MITFIKVLIFLLLFVTVFHRSCADSWVKDISVSYTSAVTDYRGENCLPSDVNKGFGGKYVWICPVTTENPEEAASSFKLIIQNDSIPIYSDLAKGAGGSYRYLLPMHDRNTTSKVHNIWLSEYEDGGANSGNINQGRGGRTLFLNWNLNSEEKMQTSKQSLPQTTQIAPTTAKDIFEVLYTESIVPITPACHCNCNEPLYQWAVIILIGLFCIISCVFVRFLYAASCKRVRARSASAQLPEKCLCNNK